MNLPTSSPIVISPPLKPKVKMRKSPSSSGRLRAQSGIVTNSEMEILRDDIMDRTNNLEGSRLHNTPNFSTTKFPGSPARQQSFNGRKKLFPGKGLFLFFMHILSLIRMFTKLNHHIFLFSHFIDKLVFWILLKSFYYQEKAIWSSLLFT